MSLHTLSEMVLNALAPGERARLQRETTAAYKTWRTGAVQTQPVGLRPGQLKDGQWFLNETDLIVHFVQELGGSPTSIWFPRNEVALIAASLLAHGHCPPPIESRWLTAILVGAARAKAAIAAADHTRQAFEPYVLKQHRRRIQAQAAATAERRIPGLREYLTLRLAADRNLLSKTVWYEFTDQPQLIDQGRKTTIKRVGKRLFTQWNNGSRTIGPKAFEAYMTAARKKISA